MDLFLLKKNQINGKNRLEIFDIYGVKFNITDFALLFAEENFRYLNHKKYYYNNISLSKNIKYNIINNLGISNIADFSDYKSKYICPAIAVKYHDIAPISEDSTYINCNIKEIICGEYPMSKVSDYLYNELENAYIFNELKPNYSNYKLKETGKVYSNYKLGGGREYIYEGQNMI